MSKEKNIKNTLLEYIYIISKQPILLKDLLVANGVESSRIQAIGKGFEVII